MSLIPHTHLKRQVVSVFFFFLFFSLVGVLPPSGWTAEQNTAFLPLKINAPNPQDVALKSDAALENALGDKNFTMISRDQAKQMVDYEGAWPPSPAQLSKIADATGFDYVAAGSLTQIGDHISLDFSAFDVLSPDSPHTAYREGASLEELELIAGEIITDLLGYTSRNFLVASIAPAGNVRIDSGAILRKITTKPGDFYDPVKLRQDLKAVFAMGYFDNVEIDAVDSDKGKKVTFLVKEKPIIGNIIISGTDAVKEEDVRDAANIMANTILNPSRINDAVARVKELYKSKGYYNTKVTAKLSYPTEETSEVRLVVDEGEKVSVRQIIFQGNTSFDDDDLEDIIQTGTWNWLSWFTESGVLKMDVLLQDASRIGAFYHNHGFIEAKVGNPVVDQQEDALLVTFPIEEGPRYRVGTVDIEGDLIKNKTALISMLNIRKEKFLNRQVLREDTLKLTDLYAEQGYAFAEIYPKVDKAETGKRVDITLKVDKGSLVYFNRVEIRGNTRTRDNVIRRDLTVKEGGVFDSKAIRVTTQKLQRLEFFEEVAVTPQPTMNEDQMNVMVDIKEKSTGQFSIGAGYSSSENVMLMGEISENNLMGTGNRLSLAANLSSQTTRFNLSYTNPRLFDSRISAGIDLFNWEREYDDYTKESTGGGLRFGQPFFGRWRIYYGYTLAKTTLSDVSEFASQIILDSMDIEMQSSARVSLVRDTRNRLFAPTFGSKNDISVKYAGGILGGDAEFTKVEGSTSWYFPLFWQLTGHIKGAAGQAFENKDGGLPVYENFYLGGMNSIRGFDSYSISPLDPVTGEKIGGDKMWFSNIAIMFPLLKDAGLHGEVFTDYGNVYAVEDNWNFSDVKKSAGVGFLWMSPMGPLRLAWGFNLDQQDGEDSSNWDFSMGGQF
ncbi:MAG: outer membrane protein assembly factor BamA [Desulfobulbaceae bacterium]|nr:outer membrane protein assembly factor BamA [Desulfobulbaceae bacterium]